MGKKCRVECCAGCPNVQCVETFRFSCGILCKEVLPNVIDKDCSLENYESEHLCNSCLGSSLCVTKEILDNEGIGIYKCDEFKKDDHE